MGATVGKNGTFLDALPSQSTMHVVMLGLDSAGKTTALYRLKFDQYLNTVPTIGFNCEKIQGTMGRAKGVQFLVWDVGGQEKLRPLWRSYTRCTDGILFVVDSVDVERMEEAKMELMRTAKCPDNQGVPVLILANKQDLPNARDPKELEKLLALHELQYPSVNLSNMGASSSSTGNIVGCGGSNQMSAANSKVGGHGRCLTPTAQHQKSFDFVRETNYVTSDEIKISTSSSSLLTHIRDDKKDIKETNFKIDIASSASLASTPTVMSPTNTFPNKKNSNTECSSGVMLQFKGWYIQPTCAITGEGLQEGLEALYDMIIRRRKLNKAFKKKR